MTTNLTDMGHSLIRTEVNMKGSSKRGRNKGMGSLNGPMERSTLENFIKEKCKAGEPLPNRTLLSRALSPKARKSEEP